MNDGLERIEKETQFQKVSELVQCSNIGQEERIVQNADHLLDLPREVRKWRKKLKMILSFGDNLLFKWAVVFCVVERVFPSL